MKKEEIIRYIIDELTKDYADSDVCWFDCIDMACKDLAIESRKQLHQELLDTHGKPPKELSWGDIGSVEIMCADPSDYPDMVGAYVSSATIKGRPATERQLDLINDLFTEEIQELARPEVF